LNRLPVDRTFAQRTVNSEVVFMALRIASSAFPANGSIPVKHTCEGDDVSPALEWSNVPERAKSLALIVDDPDAPDPQAPKMVYVHWVLYDIPTSSKGLAEGTTSAHLPTGAREGKNDWGRTGYGGPCPPIGRHRYFFKLYALDTMLDRVSAGATKAELEAAMKGHIIEQAELVGTYQGANGPAKPRKR
jgi:Raf kinase inhibitor-like YbhB/YbcL family protein